MTGTIDHREILGRFADLLSYPGAELEKAAETCGMGLRDANPEAGTSFRKFASFLKKQDRSRVEEIFTATFDLQPLCFPYVGYQLCGEGQQRALFLMELGRLYRQYGFDPGGELPDHLGTVLRFLRILDDGDCRRELIADGLLPALDKILQGLEEGSQPYADLIRSLRTYLAGTLEDGSGTFWPGMPDENRRKEYSS